MGTQEPFQDAPALDRGPDQGQDEASEQEPRSGAELSVQPVPDEPPQEDGGDDDEPDVPQESERLEGLELLLAVLIHLAPRSSKLALPVPPPLARQLAGGRERFYSGRDRCQHSGASPGRLRSSKIGMS